MSKTIALVGGTGRLGALIGNAVLDKPDVQLRLLARPGSRGKVGELEARGAQVIEGALGHLEKQTAYVWGDGKHPMDWTTYADTARYTAEVAVDPRHVPRVFSVAGDVLDFEGLVRAYESGSGKKLRVERLGSLEDLDARIEQLQRAGPANFRSYLPLMYYRSVLNGEGKLDELMNDRYPSIRPTTVREYVAKEGV
jgi:hypothetical protein